MDDNNQKRLQPDEYLSNEEVKSLYAILQRDLENILTGSRESVSNLTEQREQDADHIDLAANESNRDFALRLADRERRLLHKIKRAIDRAHQGEYGTCESCGAAITYARLMARPVATLCIDCKTEAEQLERPRRAFM